MVDLSQLRLRELIQRLAPQFIVDVDVAEMAYRSGMSFKLIHTGVYLKVDVFPASGVFEKQAIARALTVTIPGVDEKVSLATREDILLAKLRWFRAGGESSEIQWRDIQRLWSLNRDAMDLEHLERWSGTLGVRDLLDRVIRE